MEFSCHKKILTLLSRLSYMIPCLIFSSKHGSFVQKILPKNSQPHYFLSKAVLSCSSTHTILLVLIIGLFPLSCILHSSSIIITYFRFSPILYHLQISYTTWYLLSLVILCTSYVGQSANLLESCTLYYDPLPCRKNIYCYNFFDFIIFNNYHFEN